MKLLIVCLLCVNVCVADDLPVPVLPVETFFRPFAYHGFVLSPRGRYLAVLYPSNGTTNAGTIDLLAKKVAAVTNYTATGRVRSIRWKTEDRLLYEVSGVEHGLYTWCTMSVNRDGSNPDKVECNEHRVVSWLDTDPNHILLEAGVGSDRVGVFKAFTGDWKSADTRDVGRKPTLVAKAPGHNCTFIADNDGVPRVCVTRETDGSANVLYRSESAADWRTLKSIPFQSATFTVEGFTEDNRRLYVLSDENREMRALYEFDPEANKLGELVYEAPHVDVLRALFSSDHRLLGASYLTDHVEYHYLNGQAARLQEQLTGRFPNEQLTIENATPGWTRAVVLASSDRSPGRIYLFDADKGTLEQITAVAPWVNEKQMAHVRAVQFKTRDNLDLSGYLTLPPGRPEKNLPLIVLPHGGPIGIRSSSRWQRDTQFLANRGYAVLQVNFRGSGGFGRTFREKGFGEFGAAMLNDIDDALQWTIAQGIADKNRVCIYGLSYGGYASLMSVIQNPTKYRCAISFSGLTDLHSMYLKEVRGSVVYRDRLPAEIEFWHRVVGTHGNDEAYLKAHSPVYNADKVNAPVFIVHGSLDTTVPISDATRMHDALKAAGKPVEIFTRYDEAHGFVDAKNLIDVYTQIDRFLHVNNPAD